MVRKYGWLLVLMAFLALVVSGCDDSDGGDVDADAEGTVISGKVAQAYVSGALVIADKLTGGDGLGDFRFDPAEEVSTYSDADGNYTLIIPPDYGAYVLCSKGGTVRDSRGVRVEALPMLAPEGSANLTLVTTLVALHPSLKNKIGRDFDKDIANRNGVPWRILRLAKVAEAYLRILVDGSDPIIESVEDGDGAPALTVIGLKFNLLKKFARALDRTEGDFQNENQIALAVADAVGDSADDPDVVIVDDRFTHVVVLAGIVERVAQSIMIAIPDEGFPVEAAILAEAEAAVAEALAMVRGNTLAFSPSDSVIPFPNDIAWSRTGGNVFLPPPADDPPQAALFTAINGLELAGLSPNTPIAIPLENATPIDEELLNRHIRLINVSTLLGMVYGALQLGDPTTVSPDQIIGDIKAELATDPQATMATIQSVIGQNQSRIFAAFTAVQEDSFIKLYPLAPLGSGSRYLAVILERVCDGGDPGNGTCTIFADVNDVPVAEPLLYTFLKLDDPLTGDLAALEDLRRNYAPLYDDLLPMVGISEENTLEIFTFTTASKTLSVQDFGLVRQYLMDGISLGELEDGLRASDNLPYSSVTAEYDGIHASLPPVTGVNINPEMTPEPGVFISVDITASTPAAPVQITVPYTVANGEAYDPVEKSIVMFQHGWGRSKEDVQALVGPNGLALPAIAMDLPLHGDRTPADVPSGAEFFTANLPQDRINLYQSYVDMTILLRNLRSGLFDLDGDGEVFIPNVTQPDPGDVPNAVYFVGQSLGSITGAPFAEYNRDELDKVVLNTGLANAAALFDRATRPSVAALVENLGVERNTVDYFTTLGLVQLVMDPADPVYLATSAISDKILLQSAFGDQMVPNVATRILAATEGHPRPTLLADLAETPSAQPGWYMFGGEPDRYVPHGFLLNPQVDPGSGRFDPDFVMAAYAAAREQIAGFLAK